MILINSGRFALPLFALLFLVGVWVPTFGQFTVSPEILYKGDNVITIRTLGGIERVTLSPTSGITYEPVGLIRGCPTSVDVRVHVESTTSGEGVGVTVFLCDGSFGNKRINAENWTIRHEFTGRVEIGADTCLECFIESGDVRHLDSITVSHPDLRVEILSARRGERYRVDGGVRFRYNVCYRPQRAERGTDTIFLHFQRDYPSGGLNSYTITKPITYEAVQPPPPPETKKPPEPELPPLQDPTTFRNIVMPTAESPPKGRFFYGNYMVVGSLGAYGITDRFSLLGGGVFVPDFISRLYVGTLGAKYEFLRSGDFQAAVGGQIAFSSVEDSDIRTIAPYAVASYGDQANRISAALGYGLKRHVTPGETFDRNALTVAFGGNMTIARGWKLAAEAYLIETSGIFPVVFTARKFTESFAFDFGLGVDLKQGSDILFTDGLTGQIDKLAIAPVFSAMWLF